MTMVKMVMMMVVVIRVSFCRSGGKTEQGDENQQGEDFIFHTLLLLGACQPSDGRTIN